MANTAETAVCRMCRREGAKLFLKGQRCYTPKCAFDRRSYAPGQHGPAAVGGRPAKVKAYGTQLRAKQKARRVYGVREKQFRLYLHEAMRRQGVTGENLLQLLELRLDNVVYRMGFAASRGQSRELVVHGHFLVNGRKVNTPSYLVKVGDVISVKESSRGLSPIVQTIESNAGSRVPVWLESNPEGRQARVLSAPSRDQIDTDVDETLIIEFYSR